MLDLELEVVRDGFVLEVDALAPARARRVLVGPNGAGKSTLLRAILGAVPVRRGRIALDGPDAARHRAGPLAPGRGAARGLGPPGVRALPPPDACWRTSPSARRGRPAVPRARAMLDQLSLAAARRTTARGAVRRRATEGGTRPGAGRRTRGAAARRAAGGARRRHARDDAHVPGRDAPDGWPSLHSSSPTTCATWWRSGRRWCCSSPAGSARPVTSPTFRAVAPERLRPEPGRRHVKLT